MWLWEGWLSDPNGLHDDVRQMEAMATKLAEWHLDVILEIVKSGLPIATGVVFSKENRHAMAIYGLRSEAWGEECGKIGFRVTNRRPDSRARGLVLVLEYSCSVSVGTSGDDVGSLLSTISE